MIALDLDSHGSLVRWSERRKAANAPEKVVIEPLETERLPQLPAILEGFADVGFPVAIFDTSSILGRLPAAGASDPLGCGCRRGAPTRLRQEKMLSDDVSNCVASCTFQNVCGGLRSMNSRAAKPSRRSRR